MELFRTTAERIELYKEQQAAAKNQKHTKKTIKNLVLDVETRWNSVFFMLERALEFSEVSRPAEAQHICVANIPIYHI
jgi:hypothetical protein